MNAFLTATAAGCVLRVRQAADRIILTISQVEYSDNLLQYSQWYYMRLNLRVLSIKK